MSVTELELEQDLDAYLSVAFQLGNTTAFSKGTADVTPHDLKKLHPLIMYYSKKPHPFRACVKDNRKRFGPLTEKYCAIIKDLIEGNTHWRKQKNKAALSESTLNELFGLSVERDFFAFLSELSDEEVQEIIAMDKVDFAAGDVVWDDEMGYMALRQKITEALNAADTDDTGGTDPNDPDEDETPGLSFWVEDLTATQALVCEGGNDWYVVNYTVDKDGNVNVGTEDSWTPVDRAWVEEKVGLSGPDFIAEMFLAGDTATQQTVGEDGLIYKPVMREGVWMFSPGPGQKAIPKPIRVVKDGPSDPANLVVSLDELKKNFDAGAIEHVTIPTSHADKVTENTGFIRKLRFSKDEQGRTVLEAGHDFTEPEIKDKALRGTIANTSAGILFDYIHKEKGKKYGAVLAHVALTNRPWLNGMKPFGVEAAENLEVIGFSDVEQPIEQPSQDGGGESMSELTVDLATLGLSSADELKQILAERETLRAKDRERDVADRCAKWQKDGVSPALVTEAKTIMMSDKGDTVLNLSEEGKEVGLTATDIVERLIAKAPAVNLADDPVVDAAASDDKPDDKDPKTVELSQEEKKIARELWLYEEYSEADAVAEAKRRVASGGKN